MEVEKVIMFAVIIVTLVMLVHLAMKQYRTAFHLPPALQADPNKRKFFVKCIASPDGLPPYQAAYSIRHAGFSFTDDGVYVVFLKGMNTVIEWYIPYRKIKSVEKTGKFSTSITIRHTELGIPPIVTMLALRGQQSNQVLAFLAKKVKKNDYS